MKKFILFLSLFFSLTNSSFSNDENKIKKFLLTNPSQISFKTADKFLPKPYSKITDFKWIGTSGEYDSLTSNFVDIGLGKAQYSILKNKKTGRYLYGMMLAEPKSCDSFVEIIRDAYGQDFYYKTLDNVTVFGKKGKQVEGTIDIKNWRVELSCYEEGADEKDGVFLATITLGEKGQIKKVSERKKIQCTMDDGNQIFYQIDESLKLLLSGGDSSWGEALIFNDDMIVVSGKIKISINRKSGKIIITSKTDSSVQLHGYCEKQNSEKKF
jgi:hypothetical protein